MLEDSRFQLGEKVIVRLADTYTQPTRFCAARIVANEGVKNAGYLVECDIDDQWITYAVTFYDVMAYSFRDLMRLIGAQYQIEDYRQLIANTWKWGKPVGQSTPTKTGE